VVVMLIWWLAVLGEWLLKVNWSLSQDQCHRKRHSQGIKRYKSGCIKIVKKCLYIYTFKHNRLSAPEKYVFIFQYHHPLSIEKHLPSLSKVMYGYFGTWEPCS
jgi:hypothetical protein